MIKKLNNCDCDYDYENIRCANPWYLIFHSATGYFKEQNGEIFLILDLIEKYEEVFSGIKSEIETINSGEKIYYEKSYAKIGVNTDDHIYICECRWIPNPGVPCSKPVGGSRVDSAFHLSEINNFQEFLGT